MSGSISSARTVTGKFLLDNCLEEKMLADPKLAKSFHQVTNSSDRLHHSKPSQPSYPNVRPEFTPFFAIMSLPLVIIGIISSLFLMQFLLNEKFDFFPLVILVICIVGGFSLGIVSFLVSCASEYSWENAVEARNYLASKFILPQWRSQMLENQNIFRKYNEDLTRFTNAVQLEQERLIPFLQHLSDEDPLHRQWYMDNEGIIRSSEG